MPRLSLAVLVLLLALPSTAAAQRCQAPQGTSAVDEYCETVPGARGDEDPGRGGAGSGISDSTAGALASRGAAGQALARSLGSPTDAKPRHHGRKVGRSDKQPVGVAAAPDLPSANPFGAVTRAVGGDTTIGGPFILALLAVVLLILGSGWIGYRRSTGTAE